MGRSQTHIFFCGPAHVLLAALLLCLVPFAAVFPATVCSQNAGLSVHYSAGQDHCTFASPSGHILPQKVWFIALPPARSYQITLENSKKSSVADVSFPRLPEPPVWPQSPATQPSTVAVLGPLAAHLSARVVTIRFQRVLLLAIRPVAQTEGYRIQETDIRIDCKDVQAHLLLPERMDHPLWEDTLASLLCNYDQGLAWRLAAEPVKQPRPRSRSQTYVKVSVAQDGLFQITPNRLTQLGVDLATVDPRTFQLFHQGREEAILVRGEADGYFDKQDRIIFFGQKAGGTNSFRNIYSNLSHYILTFGQTTGKRLAPYDAYTDRPTNALAYENEIFLEENTLHDLYYTYLYHPDHDNFFWQRIDAQAQKEFFFTVPDACPLGEDITFAMRLLGITDLDDDPDHHFTIQLNGHEICDQTFDGRNPFHAIVTCPDAYLNTGLNVVTVSALGDTTPTGLDSIYLDWFFIDYSAAYTMTGDQFAFAKPVHDVGSHIISYRIDGLPNPRCLLVDTEQDREFVNFTIGRDATQGCNLVFQDDRKGEVHYVLALEHTLPEPDHASCITYPDIYNPDNSADYLIVYHQEFLEAVNTLQDYYQTQGLSVYTIDIEDVYNLFSHGFIRHDAVKDLLYTVMNTWQQVPAHVLLFGGTTYDPHFFLPDSTKQLYIPGWGEPVNDHFTFCVSGADDMLDFYAGRIAAQDAALALQYVNRVIAYQQNPFPAQWMHKFLFLNGGFSDSEQNTFAYQTQALLDDILCPYTPADPDCNATVISKESNDCDWGEFSDEIAAAISQGVVMVNFFGHAGSLTWDCMFSTDDVLALDNHPRLPLVFSNTCFTAAYDGPTIYSLSELFTSAHDNDGGAILFVGQPLLSYMWGSYYLSREFFTECIINEETNLGKAVTQAVIRFIAENPQYESLYHLNNVIGDPMATLQQNYLPDALAATR